MPIECTLLKDKPEPFELCPKCKAPFKSWLRGVIQIPKRFFFIFWKRDYCACTCSKCEEIVGWESPDNYESK